MKFINKYGKLVLQIDGREEEVANLRFRDGLTYMRIDDEDNFRSIKLTRIDGTNVALEIGETDTLFNC